MPLNSGTVVMQENVICKNNIIKIKKKTSKGENCRLAGEDIIKNQKVLKAGEKITTKNISLLAAIGKSSIEVKKKISLGYFTSGNELLNPSENLIGSQINNSNKYALHSLLNKKCPYIMGLHAAPSLKNSKFHFHTEFYPPLRSGSKPKILAGSESMAGTFIMDVLPEESARILRKYMK